MGENIVSELTDVENVWVLPREKSSLGQPSQNIKDKLEWLMRREALLYLGSEGKYCSSYFLHMAKISGCYLPYPEGLLTVRGVNKFFEMGPLNEWLAVLHPYNHLLFL